MKVYVVEAGEIETEIVGVYRSIRAARLAVGVERPIEEMGSGVWKVLPLRNARITSNPVPLLEVWIEEWDVEDESC